MIPPAEYERILLEFGRDIACMEQVLSRLRGQYRRLSDDFYKNK